MLEKVKAGSGLKVEKHTVTDRATAILNELSNSTNNIAFTSQQWNQKNIKIVIYLLHFQQQ